MTKLEALLNEHIEMQEDGTILVNLTSEWGLEVETNFIEEYLDRGVKLSGDSIGEVDNPQITLHYAMGDDIAHCMSVDKSLWDDQHFIENIVEMYAGPNEYSDDFAGIEEDED